MMNWLLKPVFVPKVFRAGRLMAVATAPIPEAVFFDATAQHEPCEVLSVRAVVRPQESRYVVVECGRDCEGKLESHWLGGEPVEIAGILFEMAVVARRRTWRKPMLVRGIPVR